MDWILKHKLLAILIVLVVAFGAWYLLSGSQTSAPVLTAAQGAGTPSGAQNLVASLVSLRSVNLSGAIFSDPAFQALQDDTTPVQPEPVGRPDPFAPLSGGAQASASTTKSAQLFAPKR